MGSGATHVIYRVPGHDTCNPGLVPMEHPTLLLFQFSKEIMESCKIEGETWAEFKNNTSG